MPQSIGVGDMILILGAYCMVFLHHSRGSLSKAWNESLRSVSGCVYVCVCVCVCELR